MITKLQEALIKGGMEFMQRSQQALAMQVDATENLFRLHQNDMERMRNEMVSVAAGLGQGFDPNSILHAIQPTLMGYVD